MRDGEAPALSFLHLVIAGNIPGRSDYRRRYPYGPGQCTHLYLMPILRFRYIQIIMGSRMLSSEWAPAVNPTITDLPFFDAASKVFPFNLLLMALSSFITHLIFEGAGNTLRGLIAVPGARSFATAEHFFRRDSKRYNEFAAISTIDFGKDSSIDEPVVKKGSSMQAVT